ncbi:hypothetical protein CAL7716_053410 [Calothrix sp. PCC 7716]|nr:hypothetical protein CAL7716_053410 [Calothrix sp. PCC 7716]
MINLELIGTDLGLMVNVLDVTSEGNHLEIRIQNNDENIFVSSLNSCGDLTQEEFDTYEEHFNRVETVFQSIEYLKDIPEINITISIDIFGAGFLNCQDYSIFEDYL